MHPLSIVIPAYKASFLDDTLRSIDAQTRREFVVYVGDDASPFDLKAICARWQSHFDLRYTRFEQNLGGRDLVAQWHRCIELSTEPWVWLFGDDDVMHRNGVEALLAAIFEEGSQQELFHFNVDRIDAAGRLLQAEPEFPKWLSSRSFALKRMQFEIASYAPEYAFSRAAFKRSGGFESFPRAWCSDDATWIKLAGTHGIRTITGANVQWRSSGQNISSSHIGDSQPKAEALALFVVWLDAFLLRNPARFDEPEDSEILAAAWSWFFTQFKLLNLHFYPTQAWRLASRLSAVRQWHRGRVMAQMLRSDLESLEANLRWILTKFRA